MQVGDAIEMVAHAWLDGLWQHRHAVNLPFAVTNRDLICSEVQVFNSHVQTFIQSQPATVKHFADEPLDPAESLEDSAHFVDRHDDWQTLRSLCSNDALHSVEWLVKHFVVQEQQG